MQKTLSDLSSTVFGDGRKMYQQLVKMLLEVSDPMVPPVISDGRTPVNITVDMIVESLVELDMTSQTFTLSVWFQVVSRARAFMHTLTNVLYRQLYIITEICVY